MNREFINDSEFNQFLSEKDIVTERHVKIVTEGALIGSIVEHGISENLVIVSDDAGQFNILLHGFMQKERSKRLFRLQLKLRKTLIW